MNALDIIMLLALGLGFWKGYLNGLFVEVTSLVALVAALYGAIFFSNYAGAWLRDSTEWDEIYITIASFLVTFIVIVIVIRYIGILITKVVNTAKLSTVNKLFGGAFGLVKMAFVTSVFLMFLNAASGEIRIIERETREGSLLLPILEPIAPALLPSIVEQASKIDSQLRQDSGQETRIAP